MIEEIDNKVFEILISDENIQENLNAENLENQEEVFPAVEEKQNVKVYFDIFKQLIKYYNKHNFDLESV